MKWRKEILVLPIKELNRIDFHECLTPIAIVLISSRLREENFTFPMKERFERIQAGFSTEAVEGPVSQSSKNQDAEPQDQPSEVAPGEPVADLAVKPPEVIDPKTGKLVPLPEGDMYYDSIPSSSWVNLSKKQKGKTIEDETRELALKELDYEEGGSASSSAKPSAAALPTKDCWKIVGNKLARYRFARLHRGVCFSHRTSLTAL